MHEGDPTQVPELDPVWARYRNIAGNFAKECFDDKPSDEDLDSMAGYIRAIMNVAVLGDMALLSVEDPSELDSTTRTGLRDREIFRSKFGLDDGAPKTLKYLANQHGISPQRVQQIESMQLFKLKRQYIESPHFMVYKNKLKSTN